MKNILKLKILQEIQDMYKLDQQCYLQKIHVYGQDNKKES